METTEHRPSAERPKILYEPGHRAALAMKAARNLENDAARSLRTGLGAAFDEYFLPMRPGNLISVIAMSGHGKSAVMQCVSRNCAQQLRDQDRKDECIVFVTWEQTVEEMGLIDIGRLCGLTLDDFARGRVEDWDEILRASVQSMSLPVFTVGHSLENRREVPRVTLEDVSIAIRNLEDAIRMRPALIVLDYLQGMDSPRGNSEDRRLEVRTNTYDAKNLAFEMGCPVMMGCQAKQTLMERKIQLPGQYDGEESAAIAQKSDAIIGLWMPKKSMSWGSKVTVGTHEYEITDRLLLALVAKQRFGPDGQHFAFSLDGGRNIIGALEERYDA